jgi:hypothetical protein
MQKTTETLQSSMGADTAYDGRFVRVFLEQPAMFRAALRPVLGDPE